MTTTYSHSAAFNDLLALLTGVSFFSLKMLITTGASTLEWQG